MSSDGCDRYVIVIDRYQYLITYKCDGEPLYSGMVNNFAIRCKKKTAKSVVRKLKSRYRNFRTMLINSLINNHNYKHVNFNRQIPSVRIAEFSQVLEREKKAHIVRTIIDE